MKSDIWKKEWVIRVIPPHSKCVFTWKIKVWQCIGGFFCFLFLFFLFNEAVRWREKKALEKVQRLQAYNYQLLGKIEKKEKEKKELTFLAEKKYRELQQKVQAKEQEIDRIWKLIGEKPKDRLPKRRSLPARKGINLPRLKKD